MAHTIVNQKWVGQQGQQRLVITTKNEILTRDRMSGRLAAVTPDYVEWLGNGGYGSHPRSSIRGFYYDNDPITKQYDALAQGQQPVALQAGQPGPQPLTPPPGGGAPEVPPVPPAGPPQPTISKPPNCTCPFPEMSSSHGNGHHQACPAYQVALDPFPNSVPPVIQSPPVPTPPQPPAPPLPPPALPPRAAVSDELNQIALAMSLLSSEVPYETLAEDITHARVAIFEDFHVASAGPIGHVAVVVWPDGPDQISTFICDPRGQWTKVL